MKKLVKHLLVLMCITVGLASCEQDNISEPYSANEKMESISFKYNGQTYYSQYKKYGKNIIYSNKKVPELLERLNDKPNLATLINEYGEIEYYDNYESLKANFIQNNNSSFPNFTTKSVVPVIATCTIYIDTKYRGGGKTFQATGAGLGAYYSDLSTIGFSKR